MVKSSYDSDFYKQIVSGSASSAAVVVPQICNALGPSSVLEIGCGLATWSAAFVEAGVSDVVAVDGPWVDSASLRVEPSRFVPHDLRTPLDLGRRFDLAVCMEVAEHLPHDMADSIVDVLTTHADTVLFASAIPFQGGTDHINEQPQSYWAAKFLSQGFKCYDSIRAKVWHDQSVEVWYRQNTLIFSRNELPLKSDPVLDVVHPEMLAHYVKDWRGLVRTARRLFGSSS